VTPKPDSNHDLHIPGVALAYRIKNNESPNESGYVLLFGDPRALSWNSYHNWFDYRFMNGGSATSLENVEFLITGADDRIQQLLHIVDWKQVNSALTSAGAGADSAMAQPEARQ